MPSQTVTFPCPFCGRRMGVPAELLGKQVRCPHCKQVVLAPISAAPSGVVPALPPPPFQPPTPPPVAPIAPPPPPAEPELPTFAMQRKEGADSILGDPGESEDEVFGSQPGGARVSAVPPLDLTSPSPLSQPEPADESPFEIAGTTAATPELTQSPPPPVSPSAPTQGPTAALPNPFLELEPVTLPAVFAAPPAPKPAAPAPLAPPPPPQPVFNAPTPPPPAPVKANPFGVFGATAPTPARAPAPAPAPLPLPESTAEDLDDQPRPKKKKRDDDPPSAERPARASSRRAAPASGGVSPILLILVGLYALAATGVAVYALFFKTGEKFDPGHPLSTIPDNFGEYDPAARKKVTQYKFSVDGDLPAAQRAALGEKITVGQLEIQPLKIERRPLVIETVTSVGNRTVEPTKTDALVLTLSIKNLSDLTFHPIDPAFTRRQNEGAKDFPITRIVVDKKTFSGGFLGWPIDYNKLKKKIEQQQANDSIPLKPNEQRQYVVFTDIQPTILGAVMRAKDTMQWRVELRRAPLEMDGKEYPVTAIIGVDFRSTDVKIGEVTRADP